jgi:hypothetical protein
VTHDHANGAIFPLGTTLVSCTATDGAGNTANGSFEVTVIDGTPPSITAPPDQVVEATSAAGAVVTYPACTSSDAVSAPTITYNYASGSTFPLGTTMVICTATDAASNASSATFDITVQDTTTPVVTFTGNETPYTVDQNVHITCAATDAVGVVATDGCVTIDGPAYSFGVGSHTFVAMAKDAAGHVGIASVTFEVRVTTASLCTLTERFASKGGLAHSLCVKLETAAAALARGDTKAHDNELRAYRNEVSAQSGKAIADADALVLIGLAGRL